ncbi:MAG: ParB/RepB/Spo0J family partition protein [Gammaproteobacteria bacterium]
MPVIAEMLWLDPRLLKPGRFSVRSRTDESALGALTASIRADGILRPLVVVFDESDSRYEVLVGQRRLKAALPLQLACIPVVVRDHISDYEAIAVGLADNLRHESMDAFEEGEGYRQLVSLGMTPQRIARRFDIDLNRVHDTLALAQLCEKSRQQLRPLPGSVWRFSEQRKKRLQ